MSQYVTHSQSKKQRIWGARLPFTLTATALAFFTYLILYGFGAVPETLRYQHEAQAQTNMPATANLANLDAVQQMPTNEQPTRVRINKLGINTTILRPATTDISVLNDYLSRGAVHYPDSDLPGNGNVFLFGHSTSHETVWNQAYRIFNRLEELQTGDTIDVDTKSGTFVYTVKTVEKKQDSAAFVPFNTEENLLTISTCDSFGAKEDRIVVRAKLSHFLPHNN